MLIAYFSEENTVGMNRSNIVGISRQVVGNEVRLGEAVQGSNDMLSIS